MNATLELPPGMTQADLAHRIRNIKQEIVDTEQKYGRISQQLSIKRQHLSRLQAQFALSGSAAVPTSIDCRR